MTENIKTDPFNEFSFESEPEGLSPRVENRASNENIKYTVRKSNRAKRMRIAVYCDTRVVVTVPRVFEEGKIAKFIDEKAWWIIKKIKYFSRFKYVIPNKNNRMNYLEHRLEALKIAREKVAHYNRFYNFNVNKISIKNQSTRWGSCSMSGNLNFNYKIVLLPERLANYIIIHELCHLKEFNHSARFWSLVAKLAPDYSAIKKELRIIGLSLG